jgi:MFS family permease
MRLVREFRSFNWTVRLLLVNQLTINIGFYMLMPYLANHLGGTLGLSAWMVGLVLGIRNFGQQGMYLVGGSLADRLGYKPMIVAGCALRTAGFGLLGFTSSLPGLLLASALAGFAGALFNPAVRAYLAQASQERRVEAFALFNVFWQVGMVLGPLIGLVLIGIAFKVVCATAAVMFLALTVLQWRALPGTRPEPAAGRPSVLADWRTALTNRPFLLFAAAMIGANVLSFQVYLGLPFEVRRVTGGQFGVTLLFAVSAVLAVVGQVRITAWCRERWRPAQAISRGAAVMSLAFVPLLAMSLLTKAGMVSLPPAGGGAVVTVVAGLFPVLAAAALLSLATMLVYPFEMATIVTFGGERLSGTYYGLYNTLTGVGVALGNLVSGAAFDTGSQAGAPGGLPWLLLILVGAVSAASLHQLDRAGRLTTTPAPASAT